MARKEGMRREATTWRMKKRRWRRGECSNQ